MQASRNDAFAKRRDGPPRSSGGWGGLLLPILAGATIGLLTALILKFMGGHLSF
jgi:hypothetical protein